MLDVAGGPVAWIEETIGTKMFTYATFNNSKTASDRIGVEMANCIAELWSTLKVRLYIFLH